MTSLFRALCALVTDILSGAVLQPLMDILPNPDMCINLLIDLGFSPEPSKKFGPPSGEKVEYLDQVSRGVHIFIFKQTGSARLNGLF